MDRSGPTAVQAPWLLLAWSGSEDAMISFKVCGGSPSFSQHEEVREKELKKEQDENTDHWHGELNAD